MAKGIFGFLNPAPDAPRITDQDEMRKSYKYWRFRSIYSILIGYMGFYFVRKSLAVAMPYIGEEFGYSKEKLGLILTVAGLTYGVSKFINGFGGDRTNPRYFMALGLILSAGMNLLFGLSSALLFFFLFWIINSWFQGMGWAPCSKTLVNWFSARERGVKFSIANTACSIGAAGVIIMNGYLVKAYGWRSCFFVPAAIATVISLFVLWRLRDRPQSLGLPPVEVYRGEEADLADTEHGKGASYKEVVVKYIFKNPWMWIVCLANFFVYIIRYTIMDWGPTFLMEDKGVDILEATGIVGGFEFAGIAGMLVGGWALDKVFKGYGGRLLAIYMGLCALFIFLFLKLPVQYMTIFGKPMMLNGMLLWGAGFMIYGPQCLVAVLAVNMVPKQAGAAAVGLTGLFGYMSYVISGWAMGKVVDNYGWGTGLFSLVIFALIGMLLFLVLWNNNPHLKDKLD
ncbi:MAG: MFS transporter [Verrucomicrobia bacterium]|nr:MAG: MFS transporter [Verrucomicrobiota bacterium]